MGWGRMLLMGNVGQQMDIQEMRDYLDRAVEEIRNGAAIDADQNRKIECLERRNMELQLYVVGLARLLLQKGVLDGGEVAAIVEAAEGTADDGK